MKRVLISMLLWPIVALGGAAANEGRIPISQPTTISQPGHYVLTRDLSVTAGTGITIHSDNVVLNLNGGSISSTSSDAIVKIDDGFKDVTVSNGRLNGNGVAFAGVSYISTTSPTRIKLDSLEIVEVGFGVNVQDAEYVEVLSCRISDALRAVLVMGYSGTLGGRFIGNSITGVTSSVPASLSSGLEVYGLRGGEIRGNVVTGPGTLSSIGILISSRPDFVAPPLASAGGCVVSDNTVSFSAAGVNLSSTGIVLQSNHNLVARNIIKRGVHTGILSNGSGNLLAENVVSENEGDGINLSSLGRNFLDGNLSQGNAQCGIDAPTSNNAYRNNMLRNNLGGAVCGLP